MKLRRKSPLKIVVRQVASKGHVMVVETAAYIYRRSTEKAPPAKYYLPNGQYYVIWGPFRRPVTFTGSHFLMEISVPNFLRMLAMFKEKYSGSTYQPADDENLFDGKAPAANEG